MTPMPAVWKSTNLGAVNGNSVRLRTMENFSARWHTHADSDELFYVLSGRFCIDTDRGTRELQPGQLLVVAAGTRHRGRAEEKTTVLVVDRINS